MFPVHMIPIEWLRATFPRATALVEPHFHVLRKAVSFALIGVVNVLIDTTVFLLAYSYISASPWALRPLDAFADGCGCVSRTSIVLIAANIMSWLVAVSCSYVMNSHITFAAESGRQTALEVLRHVRRVGRARRDRQYHGARHRGEVHAGARGEGRRYPRGLRGELLDVSFRGVPRAAAGPRRRDVGQRAFPDS